MKVLLLSRFSRRGASSRVRFYQYLPFLHERGIEVEVRPLLDDEHISAKFAGGRGLPVRAAAAYAERVFRVLRSGGHDLLWVQAELFPWLPAWAERLLGAGRPYVVDYDDALFHRYDAHASRAVRALLGRKIDSVMRRARLVVAGNEYLAGRARAAGARRVEVLPSVVAAARYPAASVRHRGPLTVGWIGTPILAPRFLGLIQPALSRLCAQRDARLMVVGAPDPGLPGVPTLCRPWSEATEAGDVAGFDVGVMPLTDEPWTRGKCGYKLVQYMAAGRPVVASPVGVNAEIVRHGVNGFLARDQEEWLRALLALADDAGLRARLGAEGKRLVERSYCLEVAAPRLAELLRSAAGSPA